MKRNHSIISFFLCCFLFLKIQTYAQPSGFSDDLYVSGYTSITSFVFDQTGRMFIAEKSGKIMVVNADGSKQTNPLLNINEEVFDRGDSGLLNIILDPNFLNNGYVYLYFVVDRHYLLEYGTSEYNVDSLDGATPATMARICRYTVDLNTSPLSVVANSRLTLIGETVSTGIPAIEDIHSGGGLAFGKDGTLLISTGDGAHQFDVTTTPYGSQAVSSGIMTTEEDIGQYRSQVLFSLSGKVLRIDPQTGNGVGSNPYYQSGSPRSAESRVWARGLRNPFRITYVPNTGEHHEEDGNPGVFMIGDIGRYDREEVDVMASAGLNFGWPKYEAMDVVNWQATDDNYLPNPHTLPILQYRNNESKAFVNNQIVNVNGYLPNGSCVIGGIFYDKLDFPSAYRNKYFFADYSNKWISYVSLDATYNPVYCDIFINTANEITNLNTSEALDGLFYSTGSLSANSIRRVIYGGGNKKPVAKIEYDKNYGISPLTIAFSARNSYDPENSALTYSWSFGDDNTSPTTSLAPHYQFVGNTQQEFWVKLTVTDENSLTAKDSVKIFLNNTPPTIHSTSLDAILSINENQTLPINLSANASDAESSASNLSYEWKLSLAHNGHEHFNTPIYGNNQSDNLSAIACESGHATFWQKVYLKVCDERGLCNQQEKNIYLNCDNGISQDITFQPISDMSISSAALTISASATSNLDVYYERIYGPAFISANTLTVSATPGDVKIVALQHGNSTYKPAPPVFQTFKINRDINSQSMVFSPIADKILTDGPFTISASVNSALNDIKYYIISGPASITNNVITLQGSEGIVTVRAVQEGSFTINGVYLEQSFSVINPCPASRIVYSGSVFNVDSPYPVQRASQSISTENNVLIQSGFVTFKAGNSILINPGFQTLNGAVFKAEIGGCN